MNTEQGFYKFDGDNFIFAPTFVEGNGFMLISDRKDDYEYPVNGWSWFNTREDATIFFNGISEITSSTGYLVSPENYELATSRADEGEFTKLITLSKLAIDANYLSPDSMISIKDKDGNSRPISVGRFLEVMIGYGFFCYSLRNG
jgi:hypothetical protein